MLTKVSPAALVALLVFVLLGSVSASFSPALASPKFATPTNLHLWGLGKFMNVTPQLADLGSDNSTQINNTDVVYTFASDPLGAVRFTPSSITFRITVAPGAPEILTSDDELTFNPPWMMVEYISVNMTACDTNPITDPLWSFDNQTLAFNQPIPRIGIYALAQCKYSNGTACSDVADFNVTDIIEYYPSLRHVAIYAKPDLSGDPSLPSFPTPASVGTITADQIGYPGAESLPIFVLLPLQDSDSDTTIAGNLPLNEGGLSTGTFVRFSNPGLDTSGGTLTISIYSVWRSYQWNDTYTNHEQADTAVVMNPPSVNITSLSPLASFRLRADDWDAVDQDGNSVRVDYYVFFRIVETAAQPSLVDSAGFPTGAYSIYGLKWQAQLLQLDFGASFQNFFPGAIEIRPPKPGSGSYRHIVSMSASPKEVGLGDDGSFTFPLDISPPGALRILVSNDTNPNSFKPVDAFVFSGSQRDIEFLLDTQTTPSAPQYVNLTIGDLITNPVSSLPTFLSMPANPLVFEVVPNLVEVSIYPGDSNSFVGNVVSPGQPFWVNIQWHRPLTNGMSLVISALGVKYPDGRTDGNYTVYVPAPNTGMLLGPFVANEPTTIDQSNTKYTVIINVALDNVTLSNPAAGPASDHTWFRMANPLAVNVLRDRVYLINSPSKQEIPAGNDKRTVFDDIYNHASVYQLSSDGSESDAFCVGVSLNSLFFADDNQEIWVTPYSESLDPGAAGENEGAPQFTNRSGLIFKALNNPPLTAGNNRTGMPPGSVVLSRANNGTACFTMAFDRNLPFRSYPLSTFRDALQANMFENLDAQTDIDWVEHIIGLWRVSIAIGGPNYRMVFENGNTNHQLLRVPQYILVRQPEIYWRLLPSRTPIDGSDPAGSNATILAGDEITLHIQLGSSSRKGLNYAVICTGCVLTPVDAGEFNGKPGFAPGEQGPHLWTLSFDTLNVNVFATTAIADRKRDMLINPFRTQLTLYTYGPDTVFFADPQPLTVEVLPLAFGTDFSDSAVTIGSASGPWTAHVSYPVPRGLTVVPYLIGSTVDNVLVFDPPQFEFVADGPVKIRFTVAANEDIAPYQIGTYSFGLRLTGPDANITLADGSSFHSLSFILRPAPEVKALHYFFVDAKFILGVPYGPLRVTLEKPLLPDEGTLTLTPSNGAVVTDPPVLTFTPGVTQLNFAVRLEPLPTAYGLGRYYSGRSFFTYGGSEAWKYAPLYLASSDQVYRRTFSVVLPEASVIGYPHGGQIRLEYPTPSSVTITLRSDHITFTPSVVTITNTSGLFADFTYVVSADAPVNVVDRPLLNDNGTPVSVPFFATVSGADVQYYEPIFTGSVNPVARGFQLDTNPANVFRNIMVLNRPSHLFTIAIVGEPTVGDVSLTPKCEYLEFSPAVLTFRRGVLTQSFTITPRAAPANARLENSSFIRSIDWVIAGAEAPLYDLRSLRNDAWGLFKRIVVVPEIDISPIMPVYTDGESDEILVSVKSNGRTATTPAGLMPWNAFTLHIHCTFPNVLIEPNVLSFSPNDASAIRKFRIRHDTPSLFGRSERYTLYYTVKYGGASISPPDERYYGENPDNDLTADPNMDNWYPLLPNHAKYVVLRRYNIIPQFPKVLSYGWQEASFNLTRPSTAYLSLIPHTPFIDGQDVPAFGAHATAGGRIQFDPAVVVFAPGQTVQHFQVKAIPGVRDEAVYYRVDWQLSGHQDDLMNFVEYVAPTTTGSSASLHFATWHVASASLAQLSAVMMMLALLALLLV